MYELYYLELATGLRRGELLGLKWEDIDLEHGDRPVRGQIARINGKVGCFLLQGVPPKTSDNKYCRLSLPLPAEEMAIHIDCWISTILNSTAGSTLGLPLSSQYNGSTISYSI